MRLKSLLFYIKQIKIKTGIIILDGIMYNPFKYGEIVSGEDFADRQKEIKELMLDLSGGQNIIIYSQRRFGKTSLILEVLRRLRTKGILTAHVDLFRATSKKRFIEMLESFQHLGLTYQKELLEQKLKTWQGDCDQIDDMVVLAIKL